FFDKHEFKDFLASPEAIATNILSDRLKKLLVAGVIAEQRHPENRSRKLYYLTAKGKALLPVLLEIAKWGSLHLPDLPAMQKLYKKITTNPAAVKVYVSKSIDRWERENLEHRSRLT
ncbi:MAG TPA: helix-turn-helix domain-containing protein, partial [Trichormus sp.]